ncbi:MAG TPA: hypothetical protein VL026_10360 [Rhizomicrobium sp.]|nr:hypothetical protein [Rhizomicrobium sp.]
MTTSSGPEKTAGAKSRVRGNWVWNDADPPLTLSRNEWIFLVLSVLGWALFVISLGKDTSWDFRNYHWYIPYALLNDRLGLDIAVAHHASYYNPLLDVPFYLLATHTTSWFALGVLGAVQGANTIPLYIIARQSLRMPEPFLAAALLTLLGMTGALSLSLLGTTYYDNVLSLFWLSSLAVLVVNRETLARGSLVRTAVITAVAGFLAGCAMGLKLPAAPFAMGFAVAILFLGGDVRHLATRLVAGGLGGVIGVALFAGFWMAKMQALTGNPLFPYFNEYFKSPLALAAAYRDTRFLPLTLWDTLILPWRFTLNWAIADDLPFRDMRVGLAYASTLIAFVVLALRKAAQDALFTPSATRVIFAYAGGAFATWITMFAIYRYIVGLEMLAPIVIAAGVGLLPLSMRVRLVSLGALFLAALVYARADYLERVPLGDPYVQADIPAFPHPDKTLVLMTGNSPLGFLVTLLPPQIPALRIDGWMLQPQDDTQLTRRMRATVKAYQKRKGDIYLLADAYDMGRAREALAEYRLAIRWLECRVFESNLSGLYRLCPLAAKPPGAK